MYFPGLNYLIAVGQQQGLLLHWGEETGEKTGTYTVSPTQKNVTVNNNIFTETLTECATSASGGVTSLQGRIKLLNNDVLSANNVAYLTFNVNDVSKINTELTVTSDDWKTGFGIKGTGDSAPSQGDDFYPSRNYSSTKDKCVVKLTEYTPGVKAKEELTCDLSLSVSKRHRL